MLKRIAVLTSALAVVTVLTGCGKQAENSTPIELQTENREMSAQGTEDGQKTLTGDQNGNRGAGRGPGMNLAEAKEACVDKSEGDVCQFTVANETQGDMQIVGVCEIPGQRADVVETETEMLDLSCRPDNDKMPNRGNGVAPPPEKNIAE